MKELKFGSEEAALQHLANVTGKRVVVSRALDEKTIELAREIAKRYREKKPTVRSKENRNTSRVGRVVGFDITRLDELLGIGPSAMYMPGTGSKVDVRYSGGTNDGARFSLWNYKDGPAYNWRPLKEEDKEKEAEEYEESEEYREAIMNLNEWSFWVNGVNGLGLLFALLGEEHVKCE